MILLDTDTLTLLFQGHKAEDANRLQLAYKRLQESEKHLATFPILPIDSGAAEQFDKLLQNKKLKRIGRGDLLIASIALSQKAKLVTRNKRDFQHIPGLKPENWAD